MCGWCITAELLGEDSVSALASEARTLWRNGDMSPAGVGRGRDLALRPEIRGDHVAWIDPASAGPAATGYLALLERLRIALNRELFLGLDDFEGHFALYPAGSFYRRHLDQFRGLERRTLSAILYLNPHWQPSDGGQLHLYTDTANPESYVEVEPRGGTLVTFLSARFEHQVQPALSERLSLTGWFRRRA